MGRGVWLAAAVVVAVASAGCDTDGDPSGILTATELPDGDAVPGAASTTPAPTPDAAATPTPGPDAASTAATGPDTPPGATTSPEAPPGGAAPTPPFRANTRVDTAQGEAGPVTVTDMTLTAQAGFDRITLPVAGNGAAGWRAGYVDEPLAQGSGRRVDVAGTVFLEVMIDNTGLPGDTGFDYSGPSRLPGATIVEEVVYNGIFEGQTQVFVGLGSREPFRVVRSDDGSAVLVEVITPA